MKKNHKVLTETRLSYVMLYEVYKLDEKIFLKKICFKMIKLKIDLIFLSCTDHLSFRPNVFRPFVRHSLKVCLRKNVLE